MFQPERFENFLQRNSSFGILLLRVFIGCRLLYGVIDNIISWDRMIEFSQFLEIHKFPYPLTSAVISVYLQAACAILILLGYKIRAASFLMIINFSIALAFVHIRSNDTVENMTPALAMLFGSLTLLFTGSGKHSLDYLFKRGKDSGTNSIYSPSNQDE